MRRQPSLRPSRPADSTFALRGLCVLLVLAGAVACSTEPAQPDTASGEDTAEQEDTATTQDTAVEDSAEDTSDDKDTATSGDADATADTNSETDTTDVPCTSDTYCQSLLASSLKPCQVARCEAGTCKAVKKDGACCNDTDCNDGAECTIDKCDLGSNICENKTKPNCCAGQLTLLDVGFEQSSFEGFVATEGQNNGNVKWALSNDRSHTGKTALYLGNPCKLYDNSATAASSCASAGTPKPILSKLSSQEVVLPAGKQAVAHFWIWIAAEPMFSDQLPAGNCKTPCPKGASCVKLLPEPGDICLPENDVVRVYVDAAGGTGSDPVWVSTEIKKSTDGWRHVSINLAQFQKAGSDTAVKIRWEFSANDVQNEFEGVYIDDVVIETLCADDTTLCDSTKACKDDGNPCTSEACTLFVNDKAQGICFFDQTPGCCVTAGDCGDKNDCTIDTCGKAEGEAQGLCSHAPDASNPACCQPASLFSDGFESGSISGWQHLGSNSKSVVWQVNTKEGKTGQNSVYFGTPNFEGYDDPALGNAKGPRDTICSKPLKLTGGTVYNIATFQLKMQTEWSGQPKENYKNPPAQSDTKLDELRLEVLLPTGLKTVWSSDAIYGTTEGQWVPVLASLDKWAGQEVSICLTFDAGDGLGNTLGGIWIDDFAIDVTCVKQTCVVDEQCGSECGACSTPSCDGGTCKCTKKEGCCLGNADCDDADKCTTDTCVQGKCSNVAADPKCCADKVGKGAVMSQAFDSDGGQLPSGWKASKLSGQPPFGGQASYDQTITWSASGLKKKSGEYALCFADVNGFINGGANVPAGKILSPSFTLPANGTSVVSFDLFLSTEWDDFPFKEFPFAVDQLVVNVVDTGEADPVKSRTLIWDSYAIDGSTKKAWRNIVAAVPEKLAGKVVRLEFFFDSGNANNNNSYNGACVDNLAVESFCTKPACVADADCKPSDPDVCKAYQCQHTADAFSCNTAFKGGAGCCEPKVSIPLENGEGGSLSKWSGFSTDTTVKWQVINHSYLSGSKEIYFGDAATKTYAAGSKKTCTLDTDCPSGEKCAGSPNKKVCGKAVAGTLTSDPFTLSTDVAKTAQLKFKLYLDIELSFETFQIWVVDDKGVEIKKIWDRTNTADLGTSQYKVVVDKVVDLTTFKSGKSMQIRFKFDSVDSSKNEQFQGVFLDELLIEEPCKL